MDTTNGLIRIVEHLQRFLPAPGRTSGKRGASDSFCTFCHPASSRIASHFFSAAFRLGRARI
jgi:hypothetical protein